MAPNPEHDATAILDQLYAIKTWRYLRLAMVGLVVGLAVSIAYERSKVHSDCFQTSISAYYYTPVRAYLVGALIGIGICLVCLRGNTAIEDVLLNLAGMFAPVVALVPTPDPGSCTTFPLTTVGRDVNIANNLTALLCVGLLVLIIAGILMRQDPPGRQAIIGYAIAVTIFVATATVFWLARGFFARAAHYAAAVLMFACIVAVVWCNALGYEKTRKARRARNPYIAIAAAMAASLLGAIIVRLLGWKFWVLGIETAVIGLFAVFWVVQTIELWGPGLRANSLRP